MNKSNRIAILQPTIQLDAKIKAPERSKNYELQETIATGVLLHINRAAAVRVWWSIIWPHSYASPADNYIHACPTDSFTHAYSTTNIYA
jgi:hypothetical protein